MRIGIASCAVSVGGAEALIKSPALGFTQAGHSAEIIELLGPLKGSR